jgi:small conductance mechanosensitive channel
MIEKDTIINIVDSTMVEPSAVDRGLSLLDSINANTTEAFVNDSIPIISNWAAQLHSMKGMTFEQFIDSITSNLVSFGLKIFAALVIYFVGRWVIKKVKLILRRALERRNTDESLLGFLMNMVNVVMIVVLALIVIGILGINTTSLAALFASASLAVGMALSGAVQNFAGGVMILAFRPFKVGDYIEAAEIQGTVKEISITTTNILTADNKLIIVPNSSIYSNVINNYSATGTRRVTWNISISYGDDYDKSSAAMLDMFKGDSRIFEDPAPVAYLYEMSDSAVIVSVRVWVDSDNYWSVYYDYNRRFYVELPAHGVNFPYPHITIDIPSKE